MSDFILSGHNELQKGELTNKTEEHERLFTLQEMIDAWRDGWDWGYLPFGEGNPMTKYFSDKFSIDITKKTITND